MYWHVITRCARCAVGRYYYAFAAPASQCIGRHARFHRFHQNNCQLVLVNWTSRCAFLYSGWCWLHGPVGRSRVKGRQLVATTGAWMNVADYIDRSTLTIKDSLCTRLDSSEFTGFIAQELTYLWISPVTNAITEAMLQHGPRLRSISLSRIIPWGR